MDPSQIPILQLDSIPPTPLQGQTIKTYTYQKSYVTKSGEIRYCTQTITTRVSGKKPGRPKKTLAVVTNHLIS